MKPKHKLLLVVLDGWGIRSEREGNAIALAGTPNLDRLAATMPFTELATSGLAVGLPEGQMGNSEVGHTNLGAGRVVYQDLVRINRAIESGELAHNEVLRAAMEHARRERTALHLMGLVSPGGVHSSMEHLFALLKMARDRGVADVRVHAFLDGRDTAPKSGLGYIEALQRFLTDERAGSIATVSGRYFAMDRDNRWDRIQKAYDAMVRGEGRTADSAEAAVRDAYGRDETDEFVTPTVIQAGAPRGVPGGALDDSPEGHGRAGCIRDGDAVIFFNFRADRARELTRALTDPALTEVERHGLRLGAFVCMTEYDARFELPVAFVPDRPRGTLGEVLSGAGLHQLRIAETEKYAHVTFFFNGGREVVYDGEDRFLVPSPRDVATYDLRPEMSAEKVTDELCKRIASGHYDFALVNFANPDMVGHTGKLDAAMKAVSTVDGCLGRLGEVCAKEGWVMAITADHGNVEQMIDPETGGPHTAHTLTPVPLHLIHPDLRGQKLKPGILADISPTILRIMGVPASKEMERQSLIG